MKKKQSKIKFSLKLNQYTDLGMWLVTFILLLFGTLMIASVAVGNSTSAMDMIAKVGKQLAFVVLGYLCFVFLANNFTLKRLRKWLYVLMILVIVLLLITRLFPDVYGTYAWIYIPLGVATVSIQPVEFAKVFIIVYFALETELISHSDVMPGIHIRIKDKDIVIPRLFAPVIYSIICFGIILFWQKDTGSAIILAIIAFICFQIPSHHDLKIYQKISLIALVVVLGAVIFFVTPIGVKILESFNVPSHWLTRIYNMYNPFEDSQNGYGEGYQMIQGLYSIANHSLDFGNSIQKYGWLTQAESDYIFSIVIEETSLVGLAIILGGYGYICFSLFRYAIKSRSEGFKVTLMGAAMYIMVHFIVNVGGVGGLIPLTGVPLLLISSGGSSTLATCMMIGISESCISFMKAQGVGRKKKKRA